MNERQINLNDFDFQDKFFGVFNKNLKIVEERYNVIIEQIQEKIIIKGNVLDMNHAENAINQFVALLNSGQALDYQKVNNIISLIEKEDAAKELELDKDIVCITSSGKHIRAKTPVQKEYVEKLRHHDIIFGIGPTGTGKTYLAVAMAVNAFKSKEVQKIILTKPLIASDIELGRLAGCEQDAMDVYMRPLCDALYDILGRENTLKYKERELIEIVPLHHMSGRTLENAFVILDEAQNTTTEQMKMFLTRLGFGSKVVINGDMTQINLSKDKKSGLKEALEVLENIEDIPFVFFSEEDVKRHDLVRKIITAYDKHSKIYGEKEGAR